MSAPVLRRPRPPAGDPEAGTTLVEVLVAVMILGVAVVGLMSALAFLYKATDTHRRLTTASATTQQALEIVADPLQTGWAPCATAVASYQASLDAQGLTGVAVTEVRQWDGTDWQDCSSVASLPLQRITVSVPDGPAAATASIVKRGSP
ncbi:MAG: hypothetical protein R2755_17050 [Acidimicrobiales bacterium]